MQMLPGVVQRPPGAGADRLFADRQRHRPRQPLAQVLQARLQDLGQVAGQQQHVGDPIARHLSQQPRQEWPVADGQQRLRGGGRDGAEAGGEAAHQNRALPDRQGGA